MTIDKQHLLEDIERYRRLLNEKAKNTPLISEEMISYSHKLDELLNKYASLTNKSNL
ncbi:aspartyl-phosphate phosphatase Spo0E family protein [Alkalihalobacillus sp. MEB130]|uniref:aspartyl-phosphate phosphatase Spo0E family protein n=1 Tax=Alkalihalobacillus sp. MEB130 TaxID=2976704 RepID=UPI0028DD5BBF|nr:aspartyl-phosphate phosphatase Spo0E family protein [Alkalihalobacillus sp. MEB130]MDT8862770.1 aspartyl-phosphate phosphatase Spo0E family protein [Alkalihalobacillus sp. MEB130]